MERHSTAKGTDRTHAPQGYGLAATGVVLIFAALSMMWFMTPSFALAVADHHPFSDAVAATWVFGPVALLGVSLGWWFWA